MMLRALQSGENNNSSDEYYSDDPIEYINQGEGEDVQEKEKEKTTGEKKKNKRKLEGIISRGVPISFENISHTKTSGIFIAEKGRESIKKALKNREKRIKKNHHRTSHSHTSSECNKTIDSTMKENITEKSKQKGKTQSEDSESSNHYESSSSSYGSKQRGRSMERRESSRMTSERESESMENSGGGDDSERSSSRSNRSAGNGRRKKNINKENEILNEMLKDYDKRVRESIEAQKKCYGCNWSEGPKVDISALSKVDEVFFKKYGLMDDDALCVLLETVFNKTVRDPYRRKGIPIPDWPASLIKEHYLFHVSDPDVIFTEVLKTLHMTSHEIRNSFFTETTTVKYTQDESQIDTETGEPVQYRHEEKHWEPNYKAINCYINIYKTMKDVVKLSSSEYAPERKRSRLKNMNPTLICPERIQFG